MRTLQLTNPPMRGALPFQKALREAKLYGGKLDDLYGPATAESCRLAKYRLGYPMSAIHPGHEIAGDVLLGYLTGHRPLPLAYRARRKLRLHPVTAEDVKRNATVNAFRWLIAHEPQVHYQQWRPIPLWIPPLTMPTAGITTDCSGAVTLAAKWGGLPDPNGLGYGGQGFTGTLLSHLAHIGREHVQRADLVVLGPGTGEHVCMVLEVPGPAGELVLGSHGREAGPLIDTLAHQQATHDSPTIFLAVA